MEMLASLSILLMICMIIIPQLLLIVKEAKHTEMRHNANKIIKDGIAGLLNETTDVQSYITIISGVTYEVTWIDELDGSKKQICVRWNNMNKQWQSRCERVHASKARTAGVYPLGSSNLFVTPSFITLSIPSNISSS